MRTFLPLLQLLLMVLVAQVASARAAGDPEDEAQLAFIGLHGGVFDILSEAAPALGAELTYLTDAELDRTDLDLSPYEVVVIEHIRSHEVQRYRRLFLEAKAAHPELTILSLGGFAARRLPELVKSGVVIEDEGAEQYLGSSSENLHRLLGYLLVAHAGRELSVEPPLAAPTSGLHHPDYEGLFADVPAFLRFANAADPSAEDKPRAVVAVHLSHLLFQQPKVVDALIRALEARGFLAVAIVDQTSAYERQALEFKPDVVVHTCHSRDSASFREKLDAPQLHSVFFRQQSISDWEHSKIGLAPNELNLHVVSQELIGGIDMIVGAGTQYGGGTAESFTPIPERIGRIADRAWAWSRLRRLDNAEKKVAILYWDREMGKAELMRGSATGMFLNGPRSLVKVLERLRDEGYAVDPVPQDEDELVDWMMARGRQIGIWNPGVLDTLARSGEALLIPAATYRAWFEEKLPQDAREEVIARWGEAPGEFLVWTDDTGAEQIVVPRIDLGGVILLPQPLRGEAHDTSLVHDRLVPPPHNYLATYYWLQEGFGADALIHFGTHGSELALPGKDNGLSPRDWADQVIADLPNLYPWILNNLGESSAARRRTTAVLIDHLVPPSIGAELDDELKNLQDDIGKWEGLDTGALRQRFRVAITRQCLELSLDSDLDLELGRDELLTDEMVEKVHLYLHALLNETTTTSLHVLGEAPPEAQLYAYLVVCLGQRFLDQLGEVAPVPAHDSLAGGDRKTYLRGVAEGVIASIVRDELTPGEALNAAGIDVPADGLDEDLLASFENATEIYAGLLAAPHEIDAIVEGLAGRFISPGPGNPPDRNPGSVPTGRNLYVMNPEEVPTRPSWEIGMKLVDQLLEERLQATGDYPERVAFTLSPFATFQDFGVMEAQILYLLGVRPVWNAKNLVTDIELIPLVELERPRIDVFLATGGYYRDMLPTRMRLIDKAVRLVAALDEGGNAIKAHSEMIATELRKHGQTEERAQALALARLFGPPPGEIGNAGYYYLVERSGEWDTREELVSIYLEHNSFAYTDGLWGEEARAAYERQAQGTDVVIRNWSDRTRSPVTNKYFWFKGGSLSLALEQLTGEKPAFFLADVRDPDTANMVGAEDALRQDYRIRLLNRQWIEGMMKEGYAGADQVAVCVTNSMGWEIMREGSVGDEIFEEIVEVYLRDSKDLHLREWFEAENPFALQEVAETLLEVTRKGYWSPEEAILQEIAAAYAASIIRHGEGGGLRGGGHTALREYLEATLERGNAVAREMIAKLPMDAVSIAEASAKIEAPRSAPEVAEAAPEPSAPETSTEPVTGRQLTPKDETPQVPEPSPTWPYWLAAGALGIFLVGLSRRGGTIQ